MSETLDIDLTQAPMDVAFADDETPPTEAPTDVIADAINLACSDICSDITHHLDWMETQRPGTSVQFAVHLIQQLQAGVQLAMEGGVSEDEAADRQEEG